MNTEFSEWWRALGPDEKRAASAALGTSQGHLNNVASDLRPLSAEIAVAVESFTSGARAVEFLCPGMRWRRVRDPSWPHPKGKPLLDVLPEAA